MAPLHATDSRRRADEDFETALKEWIDRYNGYERIAREPDQLRQIIGPMVGDYSRNRTIPSWSGVDLLKAWAFHIARSHNLACTTPALLQECHPEIVLIADAIRKHPSAEGEDMNRPGMSGDLLL